jgi:SAM-dependent methyltransferase
MERDGGRQETTMNQDARYDAWSAGRHYENYMGRWSGPIADRFLEWLEPAPELDWLELGCGTGALSSSLLTRAAPKSIMITDLSSDFLDHTRQLISGSRVTFEIADAQKLPFENACFDVAVSGHTLNFVPDKHLAISEMRRVVRPGGTIAFFVWDYPGGGMGFIDSFWKAAASLDPAASALDEARRFSFCKPEELIDLCTSAGLTGIETSAIETQTEFPDYETFWRPFTLGAGPAPGYCSSLSEDGLLALKDALGELVGIDGPITLPARAWAVKVRQPV